MRKKAIVISALTAAIALTFLTTLAYFTATDEAENKITLGGVDIEIEEWIKEGDKYVSWPENGVTAMPNTEIVKYITVKNTGDHPAWVRLHWTGTLQDQEGSELEGWEDLVEISPAPVITDNWSAGEDSYWLYHDYLQSGDETSKLELPIQFSAGLGNDYQGAVYTLTVEAQAVQSENNAGPGIEGWPGSES